jgi:23S rRNA (uracil1939-C5)-methyltransferase
VVLHPAAVTALEVRAERMVAGGRALCRDADGRVVLVDGAIPGERVLVETSTKKGATFGDVVEVLEASPDRVRPPCPYVARGCGGCDWQHVAVDRQRHLRLEIVTDALRRLGRVPEPVVRLGPPVPAERSRGVLRVGAVDGRLGLRRREGHEIVAVDDCLVAVPALAELLARGAVWPGTATELTLRVSDGTGERLLLADPTADDVDAPQDVTVVGVDDKGRRWTHTEIAGHRLRVSARSFFQTRGAGAEALVEVAGEMVAGAPDGRFLDLYGGVGLFSVTLAGDRPVTVVERSKSAAADARENLVGRDAEVVARPVEGWRPREAAVVVADPARAGLGAAGVAKVDATGTTRLVLVSCDAASLGRDTAALGRVGFTHAESISIDMFGHTGHVEVATRFDR